MYSSFVKSLFAMHNVRKPWIANSSILFLVALSRRFFFSIFGCLKQYISGISCGWILKDVFQHSNEPEKWFTNEGKRKWRCWRSFIVFTKFLLDLSDIAWVVRPCDRPIENTRKGSGHTSSFLVFYLHCPHQISFTDGKSAFYYSHISMQHMSPNLRFFVRQDFF